MVAPVLALQIHKQSRSGCYLASSTLASSRLFSSCQPALRCSPTRACTTSLHPHTRITSLGHSSTHHPRTPRRKCLCLSILHRSPF
uniref:Chromodomain helicase DNA binding protein 7 n=1 Tax=Pipistrellus kuhlii TaxID=59472 RepID=A0A7J7VM08_PIPKU|nr:chromodomain helicase DNA binding protein 7 [Pipistrellus kuhlii]